MKKPREPRSFQSRFEAVFAKRVSSPSQIPEGYVELQDAINELRPHLFGAKTEPALDRMELNLAESGPPGTYSALSPMLPGHLSIAYTSDPSLLSNSVANADWENAKARAYRLQIQEDSCRRWLSDRESIVELPDGSEVIGASALMAFLSGGMIRSLHECPSEPDGASGSSSNADAVAQEKPRDKRPKPTRSQVVAWQKMRIEAWDDKRPAPSEGTDWAAVRSHFGDGIRRSDYRLIRHETAPKEWWTKGPRKPWGKVR